MAPQRWSTSTAAQKKTKQSPQTKSDKNKSTMSTSVKVIIRKRPVSNDQKDMVDIISPAVIVHEEKVKVDLTRYMANQNFLLDDSFGEKDGTKTVYIRTVRELVHNIFDGGTSTCFCFGQTASGKTFTLFGAGGGQVSQETSGLDDAEQGGLYLLAAYEMYKLAEAAQQCTHNKITVAISMYEIKGQKLYDLLNEGKELSALEDHNGVLQLVGLSQHSCETLNEFLEATDVGRSARSTAATGANATSSRSHCSMLVRVYHGEQLLGKLSLIDLAGSERGADNENTDAATRKEGRDINTSLLALKEVIRAMQSGNKAPFRQSRLTQVLEESLTGKQCRTLVIGCVSGASCDVQHTINTLRYAQDLCPKGKKSKGSVIITSRTLSRQDLLSSLITKDESKGEGSSGNKTPTKTNIRHGSVPAMVTSNKNLKAKTPKESMRSMSMPSNDKNALKQLANLKKSGGSGGKNHTGVGMKVRVLIRKRPVGKGITDVIHVDAPTATVIEKKTKVDLTKYDDATAFAFDDAFCEYDDTKIVYDRSIKELVSNIFEGGTSMAFCFGQTNSGKSFTLFGAGGGQAASQGIAHNNAAKDGGLYLLSAHDIYNRVNEILKVETDVVVALSMYEIKGQKMYDLLNDRKELTALEDGNGVLQLVGLTQHACINISEFLDATNVGRSARSTTATGANATSSRSHCAMLVRVYKDEKLLGKLSLIDLAGSERGADNENTDKTTQKEGRDINTSLMVLKEVIRALQSGNKAPFRQSRLTQVLEESLTGHQCRTVVIGCVSGAEQDTQNSINTLRYAMELGHSKVSAQKLKKLAMAVLEKKKRASTGQQASSSNFHKSHFHAPHIPTSMMKRLSKAMHVRRSITPVRSTSTNEIKPITKKVVTRGSRGRSTPVFAAAAGRILSRNSMFKKQEAAKKALEYDDDEETKEEDNQEHEVSRNALYGRLSADSVVSIDNESVIYKHSPSSSIANSEALRALVKQHSPHDDISDCSGPPGVSLPNQRTVSGSTVSSSSSTSLRGRSPDNAPPPKRRSSNLRSGAVKVVKQPTSSNKKEISPRNIPSKYMSTPNKQAISTPSSKSSNKNRLATSPISTPSKPNSTRKKSKLITSRVMSETVTTSSHITTSHGSIAQTKNCKKRHTLSKDDWEIDVGSDDVDINVSMASRSTTEDNVLITFNSKNIYTEELDKEVTKSNLARRESLRLTALYEELMGGKGGVGTKMDSVREEEPASVGATGSKVRGSISVSPLKGKPLAKNKPKQKLRSQAL